MCSNFRGSQEDEICLYTDGEKSEQLSMSIDKLRLLTEAGNRLNSEWLGVIEIDSPH